MKSEICVQSNFIKLGVKKLIGQINETIENVNKKIQYEELERNNETTK